MCNAPPSPGPPSPRTGVKRFSSPEGTSPKRTIQYTEYRPDSFGLAMSISQDGSFVFSQVCKHDQTYHTQMYKKRITVVFGQDPTMTWLSLYTEAWCVCLRPGSTAMIYRVYVLWAGDNSGVKLWESKYAHSRLNLPYRFVHTLPLFDFDAACLKYRFPYKPYVSDITPSCSSKLVCANPRKFTRVEWAFPLNLSQVVFFCLSHQHPGCLLSPMLACRGADAPKATRFRTRLCGG